MRVRPIGLMLLTLSAACSEDGQGPTEFPSGASGKLERNAAIEGRVFTLTFGPDSASAGVAGARVTLIRVGDLPADTSDTLGPPIPGDTMLWARGWGIAALFDTVVGPPDTITPPPPDTIVPPPDTIPPPPPPSYCREGRTVARVRTDREGRYAADRLPPGIYDIRVEPPVKSGLQPNQFCAVFVRGGERTRVDVLLWPEPDPFLGRRARSRGE